MQATQVRVQNQPRGHALGIWCRRLHLQCKRIIQANQVKNLAHEVGELYRHMQLDMAQAERNRAAHFCDSQLMRRQAFDRAHLSTLVSQLKAARINLAHTEARLTLLKGAQA